MKAAEKDAQMQLFVSGEAQIMVATTVIEVGVNVPNASVMIIENALCRLYNPGIPHKYEGSLLPGSSSRFSHFP